MLGVGAPALAGALWAVEQGAGVRELGGGRRPRAQRERLAAEFDVAPGDGPYAWLRAPVAEALAARRIYVAPGSGLGRRRSTSRVTLSDAAATDRLLEALRTL